MQVFLVHLRKSEVSSHLGARDPTRVPSSVCFYLLSHLADPSLKFLVAVLSSVLLYTQVHVFLRVWRLCIVLITNFFSGGATTINTVTKDKIEVVSLYMKPRLL